MGTTNTAESPQPPSRRELTELIDCGNMAGILEYFQGLSPGETARSILELERGDQVRLLTVLKPAEAAEVMRDVGDEQAADVMGGLSPPVAAAIVDRLPSDEQADVLGKMDPEAADAILHAMPRAGAADAAELMKFSPTTAGGLMVTEYLSYSEDLTVDDVVHDLRVNRDKYAAYDVQYVYVTEPTGRLTGVIRMRDILFAPFSRPLRDAMLRDPVRVRTDEPLNRLQEVFEEHHLLGVPAVDERGRLVGVVQPEAVKEAAARQASRQFLRISGIVAGEEFRTMPLRVRAGRRLAWLSINIFLNIIAASVIAFYQDTIQAVVALAVFLPIISDMSGCSGNQAVAVSIRELSLGYLRPREFLHVLWKEAGLGVLVGIGLGAMLAGVVWLWKGNAVLALVVGVALAVNTLVSVLLGGLLPLALRRLKIDPALMSGPILTTVTDTCGFFLVLSLATLTLSYLTGG